MTEEILEPLDKFRTEKNGVVAYKAYISVDKKFMKELIPEPAKWGKKKVMADPLPRLDEEGEPLLDESGEIIYDKAQQAVDDEGELVTEQKLLEEFVGIQLERPNDEVLFKLSGLEYPVGRRLAVTLADLQDWMGFLAAYGKDVDDLLTHEEFLDILKEQNEAA